MFSKGFYLYRGWGHCCQRGSTFIAEVGDIVVIGVLPISPRLVALLSEGLYLFRRGLRYCCLMGSTFIAEVGGPVVRGVLPLSPRLATLSEGFWSRMTWFWHILTTSALSRFFSLQIKWLIKIGSTYSPPPPCTDLYNETLGNLFSSITRFVGRNVCDGLIKLHFQSN